MNRLNNADSYKKGDYVVYTDITKRESDKTSTGIISGRTRDGNDFVVQDGAKQKLVSPSNIIGLQELEEQTQSRRGWFFESGGTIDDLQNELNDLELQNQDFETAIQMADFPSKEKELAKQLLEQNQIRIKEINEAIFNANEPEPIPEPATAQTTNDKQQTTNNKQQTTNNKQQTTNDKRPTTNNKQQTTNRQRQTTNQKGLSGSHRRTTNHARIRKR
jgi:hypothetical protein